MDVFYCNCWQLSGGRQKARVLSNWTTPLLTSYPPPDHPMVECSIGVAVQVLLPNMTLFLMFYFNCRYFYSTIFRVLNFVYLRILSGIYKKLLFRVEDKVEVTQ